jgi:7,8-dihydropterin-6-yl-methyl-4-(beta-D-ribofuranosyl)aminobenzene 5'-phosphate synthase
MKITCLVDNAVQAGSRFWGEHGLSFLIETEGKRLLFDTGQSGTVLLHNLQVAGIDPASISAVALSHAHYDHTGGLKALLAQISKIPLYAHSDLFRERFSRRETKLESIGLAIEYEELSHDADLRLSAKAQQILPGVYTTGEITARPEVEGRSARHLVRDGDQFIPDPYQDDLSLVLEVNEGLVVLCGCCHAGLLNTLQHVRDNFGGPIIAVIGGTHLESMNQEQLHHLVQVLRTYGTPRFYPNHCTGQTAYVALATAFGSRVMSCPVGTELVF